MLSSVYYHLILPFPRPERSGSPAANTSDWNQKRGNATLVFKGTGSRDGIQFFEQKFIVVVLTKHLVWLLGATVLYFYLSGRDPRIQIRFLNVTDSEHCKLVADF
jgi:hypothetical protein